MSVGKSLLESAETNSGGTFYWDGSPIVHEKGYVVGGRYPSLEIDAGTWRGNASLAEEILQWCIDHPSEFYGSWVDEDGKLYIDAVLLVQDKETAIDIAKDCHQIAIWDVANKKEIFVDQ